MWGLAYPCPCANWQSHSPLPVAAEQEKAGGQIAQLSASRLKFPHTPCPAQQFFHELISAAFHALFYED